MCVIRKILKIIEKNGFIKVNNINYVIFYLKEIIRINIICLRLKVKLEIS